MWWKASSGLHICLISKRLSNNSPLGVVLGRAPGVQTELPAKVTPCDKGTDKSNFYRYGI